MAASRGGIKTVIIPKDNEKDLSEIPDNIKRNLIIKPISIVDEALSIALLNPLIPFADDKKTQENQSKDQINLQNDTKESEIIAH